MVLVIYLFQLKSGNRLGNLLLAGLLLGINIRIGKSLFNYYLELEPWHRNLGLVGFLWVGPFTYLYGCVLLKKDWKWNKLEAFHFLLALVFLIFSPVIPNEIRDVPSRIIYGLILLQIVTYLIVSWRLFLQKEPALNRSNRIWYRQILGGVTIIWATYLLIFLEVLPLYLGGAILYTFMIYAFTYLLLKLHVFKPERYGNSTLNHEDAHKLLNLVKDKMDNEKLFVAGDLTLPGLSRRLGVSHRDLSQAINTVAGVSFSEFINQYRVKEAMRLFQEDKQQTKKIATVAFESGFNNLTSFNQIFKVSTGQTPRAFRKGLFMTES